jgi:hypothetical protein
MIVAPLLLYIVNMFFEYRVHERHRADAPDLVGPLSPFGPLYMAYPVAILALAVSPLDNGCPPLACPMRVLQLTSLTLLWTVALMDPGIIVRLPVRTASGKGMLPVAALVEWHCRPLSSDALCRQRHGSASWMDQTLRQSQSLAVLF